MNIFVLAAVSCLVCCFAKAEFICSTYDSCVNSGWECPYYAAGSHDRQVCCSQKYDASAQGKPPGFYYDKFVESAGWRRDNAFRLFDPNDYYNRYGYGNTYEERLRAANDDWSRVCYASNIIAWAQCTRDYCAPFLPQGQTGPFYNCVGVCNIRHPMSSNDLRNIAQSMYGCRIWGWC